MTLFTSPWGEVGAHFAPGGGERLSQFTPPRLASLGDPPLQGRVTATAERCKRRAMQPAAHALTEQFLAWVAEAPRSYADAEAWRRSCPHLSIWEDAIADGLVRFENGASMQQSRLVLTAQGRALLKR